MRVLALIFYWQRCSLKLKRSISGTAVVGCACHSVTSTFATAVVAEFALFKFAGVSAIALLLFLLEVSALGHAFRKIPILES